MKIINPNKQKIGILNEYSRKCKPIDAIASMIKIDKKYIQYEQAENDGDVLETKMHPLIQAAHIAYSDHLPLVLTPDSIWYCITSAVATYINKHSEEMRKTFVNHEGKKRIEVRRDDFVFGQKNPWNEVVDEFTEKIKENTADNIVDRLQADFTTTSKISRVVSQIVIMDAMQKYFEYYCSTCCAIPEIRLTGEKSDWERIRTRTNELVQIIPKFKEWTVIVDEILNEFINAFDNKIDNEFWNSIYKIGGGSGGPYLSGWLISFFPFLKDGAENRYCWNGVSWKDLKKSRSCFDGLTTLDFLYHLNQVPFIWNYLDNEVDMLFTGGLVGVRVDAKDQALVPIFGYAVSENKVVLGKEMNE